MTVPQGERFVVLEDHDVHVLTSWFAPVTGGFEGTLPAGTILVSSGQVEGAPGFPCRAEDYEAVEQLIVPKRDRRHPQYGGYWFVLLEAEIGTWFDRA